MHPLRSPARRQQEKNQILVAASLFFKTSSWLSPFSFPAWLQLSPELPQTCDLCRGQFFTWMFLKSSTARLEAVLAGATLLQGGHGLQPGWDMCLFLCTAGTAGTADSQDRAVWAQVRASELGLGHASWLPGRLGVFLHRLQVITLLELCMCVGCAVRPKRKFL